VSRRETQLDYVNQDRLNANPLYVPPPLPLFDGATFDEKLDGARLNGQRLKVFELMKDGKYRTITEIKAEIKTGSETAISARLRDFRKARWGGHKVDPRRRGNGKLGVWEYRLILNPRAEQ
jgi:hypothetical protein